jgi:hypothetical protein
MERDEPPLLWVVLNESCLRCMVGGREAMRGQFAYLLAQAESPHVTLQVLPFDVGAPTYHKSFTLLNFAEDPSALYADAMGGGRVVDSPTVVAEADMTYDRLRADALPPEASLALIRKAMEELHHE